MAERRVTVTVGPQGRLVIPAQVRRALNISPGDRLSLAVDGERLSLEPSAAAAARARGMLSHLRTDASVVNELIAERREEAAREDR